MTFTIRFDFGFRDSLDLISFFFRKSTIPNRSLFIYRTIKQFLLPISNQFYQSSEPSGDSDRWSRGSHKNVIMTPMIAYTTKGFLLSQTRICNFKESSKHDAHSVRNSSTPSTKRPQEEEEKRIGETRTLLQLHCYLFLEICTKHDTKVLHGTPYTARATHTRQLVAEGLCCCISSIPEQVGNCGSGQWPYFCWTFGMGFPELDDFENSSI